MDSKIVLLAMVTLTIGGILFIGAIGAGPPASRNPGSIGNSTITGDASAQDIYLKATQYGVYEPSTLRVKRGIPVRLHFSADKLSGCGHALLIPAFGVQVVAPSSGEKVVTFTPSKAGTFPFHCSMKMFNGTLEVVQ